MKIAAVQMVSGTEVEANLEAARRLIATAAAEGAALVRELHEELGISITACSPWLTRVFTYPHATVRLNFWRVTAWEGEIGITAPLEHAAIDWQQIGAPATVAPILPANDPILKALSLPTMMAITNAEQEGTERQLERLEEALAAGLRLALGLQQQRQRRGVEALQPRRIDHARAAVGRQRAQRGGGFGQRQRRGQLHQLFAPGLFRPAR